MKIMNVGRKWAMPVGVFALGLFMTMGVEISETIAGWALLIAGALMLFNGFKK